MTTLIVELPIIAIIRSMQDSHRKLIFTFCHCKLALACYQGQLPLSYEDCKMALTIYIIYQHYTTC